MSELLGTDTGLVVDGVGQLYWAVVRSSFQGELPDKVAGSTYEDWDRRYEQAVADGKLKINNEYGLPRGNGFSLLLILDTPFRDTGLESYSSISDPIEPVVEHSAQDDRGFDAETRFPSWFLQYLSSIQELTGADQLNCYDDGPERDMTHHVISIEVTFGLSNEMHGSQISNPNNLLGNLAFHLAGFKAEAA